MTKRVSAREARAHFAELTDEVRYTGEPVIVEKQGKPFVVVISIEDLEKLDHLRREAAWRRFTAGAKKAALPEDEELTDEEIVAAVKRTRRELNRERYGWS